MEYAIRASMECTLWSHLHCGSATTDALPCARWLVHTSRTEGLRRGAEQSAAPSQLTASPPRLPGRPPARLPAGPPGPLRDGSAVGVAPQRGQGRGPLRALEHLQPHALPRAAEVEAQAPVRQGARPPPRRCPSRRRGVRAALATATTG
eukprot:CAMPEP_0175411902 /NCGR_PEP_ID=MMETSP0095-20121207/42362_1 /TAXON_ID=311494 /ORGANISM="Alexandrium monilatum, Strain CCMP3105" /LENGTH=148 /DNA_ID=CAMNT_0016710895 /DNA_START=146 /DNA_END=588 /DNA_ORIENTATION=+